MRLITRGGYNWASRYPWIVEAARKIRQKHFVLDGEAVVLGVDGISDFNALHSRKHDYEVPFCAFDILAEGGDDLRMLPLSMRKNLERLLARRREGVFVNPFERGELGRIYSAPRATWALSDGPEQVLGKGRKPQSPRDGAGAARSRTNKLAGASLLHASNSSLVP